MTIGLLLALASLVVFTLAAVCVNQLAKAVSENADGKFILTIALIGAAMALGIAAGANIMRERYEEDLSRGVTMQQVAVKGTNVFYAAIQLNYKDGKLDSIALVKDSTTTPPPKK